MSDSPLKQAQAPLAAQTSPSRRRRWSVQLRAWLRNIYAAPAPALVFGLVVLASWLLLHLYRGISQDGILYVMQGLAHLRPELYQNDVYLRYGSQDQYTVFGPICAAFIRALGVDHAAALLTLLSQLAFFFAAWRLALLLLPRSMALLGVGLLCALDLTYGSQGVFHVVEDVLSPRTLAEALVLWGIAAAVLGRNFVAILLIIIAAAIHPIMAAAGMALMVWIRLIMPHPTAAAIGALAVVAALAAAAAAGLEPPARIDTAWLNIIGAHTPYLLLSRWSAAEWNRTAVPLTTLCLAIIWPWSALARSLSIAAIGTAVTGLGLALVGCDWLHLVVATQAQPWRWLWLSMVIATLLLPAVTARLWNAGLRGRVALALLATAYLTQDVRFGLPIELLSIGAAWWACTASTEVSGRTRRLLIAGAVFSLLLGLAWELLTRVYSLQFTTVQFPGSDTVTQLRRVLHNSLLPAFVLGAIWWVVYRYGTAVRLRALAACALLACVALLPASLKQWSRVEFTPSIYQAFRGWRERIPRGAEVLLPANPLRAWVYLERPSYLSVPQLGSTLFSRTAALTMTERLRAVLPFLYRESILRRTGMSNWALGAEVSLQALCSGSELQFVATRQTLAAAPLATLPPDIDVEFRGLKLYRCANGT